ncbi:MAG TPA: adenine phosphoribosyltransferase, partial [Acidobacteriota bacterium]|nr:adenine phosphoribosyltransferase [Acidobacteriota bacterium]
MNKDLKEEKLNLADYVKAVPDFPKRGIMFRDISPLLESPTAFRQCIDEMHVFWQSEGYDKIVA